MTAGPTDGRETGEGRLRLDKWLWHARFHKSRSLAAQACESGRIRLNGTSIAKAHQAVRAGDVLTFPLGARIRIVRVLALGTRRGPAIEARMLYEDLGEDGRDPSGSTPGEPAPEGPAPEVSETGDRPPAPLQPSSRIPSLPDPGASRQGGRPTKADRRALERLRRDE